MAYNKNSWQDGDIITAEKLNHMEDGIEAAGGLTNDVKTALLQIAEKVAYIDEHGQDYYDDLYDALYPSASLVSISAVYTQSGTVYPTTSLSALKDDLAVTAYYDDTSSEAVPAADYMLSGALTVGTSVITASYNGKTATFNVTVSAVPTVSSISAVYTQSGTVYDTDSLDSLKADLVVTATYSDSSTATVPSTDYTLSGTLTEGTSTITVSYESKTTTFNVTVSAMYVQDGLIMWLDGIRNGTNGTHESTLTTWVDQSGNGWDWTNSNATVTENSVVFNGTDAYLYRAYQSVPSNVAMIEIVAKKTKGGCMHMGYGRNKVGNINIPSTGNNIVFHTAAGSGADKNTAFDFGTAGEIHSANSAGYLDGQAIQSFASSAADWQYEYPSIGKYRGSTGSSTEYVFEGEIYCIRLYSRILTEQEILANYAVDVARFGIGG